MTMNEKPQIVAKEVSNEAGVYEVTVVYPSETTQSGGDKSGTSILRTTPKMFAFQTHTPRGAAD